MVAFCSPAKSFTFSGLLENPISWQKVQVLKGQPRSKQVLASMAAQFRPPSRLPAGGPKKAAARDLMARSKAPNGLAPNGGLSLTFGSVSLKKHRGLDAHSVASLLSPSNPNKPRRPQNPARHSRPVQKSTPRSSALLSAALCSSSQRACDQKKKGPGPSSFEPTGFWAVASS